MNFGAPGPAEMASLNFETFFREHYRRIESLYQSTSAKQWDVSLENFAQAVLKGIHSAALADAHQIPQLLDTLRAKDLVLALGCVQGNSRAWDVFCAEYRSALYEAAYALVHEEVRARELADSLLAELFGAEASQAGRQSRLAYFHGRSSLKTWLRAIVYQRFVDEYRRECRLEPLGENATELAAAERSFAEEDDRRYSKCLSEAVEAALAELPAPDKLLLSYCYVQQLTLKQIGRLTDEHEATISRHLEALRKKLRKRIEGYLRRVRKLSAFEVERCLDFAARGVSVDLERALRTE